MDELIPVIIAAVLGALIWKKSSGRSRPLLLVTAVIAVGVTATLLSGEYIVSWVYLLQDLAESAVGVASGIVFFRWAVRTSVSGKKFYGAKTTH
jgi:hypothetical protein